MTQDLGGLLPITALLRDRAQDKHRERAAESRRIAAELAQLDRMRIEAQAHRQGVTAQAVIGADTAWHDWLMRRRADLMRDAAIARAREEDSRVAARRALARDDALAALDAQAAGERRQRRDAARLDALHALTLLRGWNGEPD